ncbi:MAG: type II secretion system protein GspH [Wenzhouxiangella sp.]|nr:MAG: type II secretion system protein GspH [Wenzhouxiangella sp.]
MLRPAPGFTLIELLVVVLIGAILATLAVLSVGPWQSEDDPERQLARFAALLDAQCEQALFQSRPRGIRLDADGYDFWQATADGWARAPDDRLGRPRSWAEAAAPLLLIEGRRQQLEETAATPQIVCQPLGEMTAFELAIGPAGERVRLSASAGGRLSLDPDR